MSGPSEADPPSSGAPTQPPGAANNTWLSGGGDPAGADSSVTEVPQKGAPLGNRPATLDGDTIEDVHTQCKELYTEDKKAEAWAQVAQTVETYSDKIIERWIKEIDTNLVFAGLFSAILTAFNVPAYALLSPASPDPSIALLQQISSKLDSFSINHPFVNSTQLASTNSPDGSTASLAIPRWAVWLNGLWFSGLILSLTSASMGLMSKQWLNEYSSGVSKASRHAARMRQYRLENFKKWHVESVVNTIPVLLQLSLVCFLAGLLIFLWNLHSTIATIASTLVGLLAIFTIAVTLLPLWDHRCAYLSPQTRTLYYIWQPKRFTYWVCDALVNFCCGATGFLNSTIGGEPSSPKSSLLSCLQSWKEPKQTWQGRERSDIDKKKHPLDMETLGEAYRITLHPATLSAVTVCLTDFDPEDVVYYFQRLHKSAQEHFRVQETGHLAILGQQQMLWLRVLLSVCLMHENSPESHNAFPAPLGADEAKALGVYLESGSWSSTMPATDGEWAASALDALTDYLEGEGTGRLSEGSSDLLDLLRMERTKLMRNAIECKEPVMTVVQRVISGVYRQVRLEQKRLTEEASRPATDTRYLRSVWHQFLEYASRALTLYTNANGREPFRAYTRDVLTKLTHALLELFTQGHRARTTIKSAYLHKVMLMLCDLDDTRVGEYVTDELVPDILDLAGKLVTAKDYDEDLWVNDIQSLACALKAQVTRVQCKPAATWAYSQVCLQQENLGVDQASSDEIRAAYTSYLQSADYFLECANHVSKTGIPTSNLEIPICAHTQDVVTKLTRTLLELFEKDRVRTTIESTYLDDVMRKLCVLDDTRVEECIPDELVPKLLDLVEKLATAARYYDNRWAEEIQDSARELKANIARIKCKLAATWAYRRVHLEQKPGASSEEARAAQSSYLQSVDNFLECADHASTSSDAPASDLESVRTYTRDVLTKLTHALLELFSKDRVQTTIESKHLSNVMGKLCDLDDARVEASIPDELVPDILDLAKTLATAADYYDNTCVDEIQGSARELKANIARVKCKLAATWAYRQVRVQQKPGASSDEARAAHTSYLQSVDNFLECADHASTSLGPPANDLQSVRTYTRDVLTKLTHTLLEMFAKDRVRSTIESTYLDNVMRKLCGLDDARVEVSIPDELVPEILDLAETLATAADYYDNTCVDEIQGSARALKANIGRVKCNLAAIWAYRQVHLQQKPGLSSDEARVAHTSYLRSADYFLECASHASTPSGPSANDLETVHAHAQDVVTELTRALLELFAKDRVRTTIQSTYLKNVMGTLRDLDDARLGGFIPDELVPKILDLAEKLATATDYCDNTWVGDIQDSACSLDENINRVKCNKSATTWAYDQACLRQKHLIQASSDEARAAHTRRYLQRVDYFLACVNRAPISSLPANDQEMVPAYTQEVLTQLTRTLLELFAKDQTQTAIESTYLDDILRRLRGLDDARVGEFIPDELVPDILDLAEKLATANHYADDHWVESIQSCARRLQGNVGRVKCGKPATAWAYDQVRLLQEQLTQTSLDEARVAHSNYLQSVDYLLGCTEHDLTSCLSANAMESVRGYTRDVLTNLTHILLELSAKDMIRITIESTYLDDVMRKLRDLDDARVGEFIPDELAPHILDLAEKLATATDYYDNGWVREIQQSARAFKENILKCRPSNTTFTETSAALGLSATGMAVSAPTIVQSSGLAVQVDAPSGADSDDSDDAV
ncbi:hypothetical protein VTO73DRAFT_15183 [Trametes versicolor]